MIRKASILAAAIAAFSHAGIGAQETGAADNGYGAAEGGQGQAAAERGAIVYETTCAHCHDRLPEDAAIEMLPGPESLSLKYGGALSPYIEERPDLASFEVLRAFLRNGTGSMPPFRKTEISDEDIAAVAAHFARTSSALGEEGGAGAEALGEEGG